MSTLADPKLARLWGDFDGFRAPAFTPPPSDASIFTDNPVSTLTSGGTEVPWGPYGGIEAGFNIKPDRDVKKLHVSNFKAAPYRVSRGPKSNRIALKPVDYSKASILTVLQGGRITETASSSGVFRWEEGDFEDFALGLHAIDGAEHLFLYCERVTLVTMPPKKVDTESLDGFEIELECLDELVPFTNSNPLAV